MTQIAPGRSHRKGLTVMELLRVFPDDATAEKWFEKMRWANGRFCLDCGSTNTAAVAGRKLYREVSSRQATAWFLMQRIRETSNEGANLSFPGPVEVVEVVEVDETYVGGKRKNMSNAKRKALKDTGRGAVGKTAVVGAKDRTAKQVTAKVVAETGKAKLQGFVSETAALGATLDTDEATAFQGIPFDHEAVKHSVSEYVRGIMAHTNGAESFWSLLKRGYHGTFHHLFEKHLNRYVQEFAGRHNVRDLDTIQQMVALTRGMVGKRLRYANLVA